MHELSASDTLTMLLVIDMILLIVTTIYFVILFSISDDCADLSRDLSRDISGIEKIEKDLRELNFDFKWSDDSKSTRSILLEIEKINTKLNMKEEIEQQRYRNLMEKLRSVESALKRISG